MIHSIENRELFTLSYGRFLIHGTYHKLKTEAGCASARARVGILFLNSLSLPRTATGDSAAYWADSLAQCGYPAFRIDLPGLGDSPGELPLNLLDFINSGGFAASASHAARELVTRFGLSGVVIVGHCAGCVSALYAASQCAECRGLVLMDPYFHLPQAVRPKMRQTLSQWALKSPVGRIASHLYDWIREFALLFRRNTLPPNANNSLLQQWKSVASSGRPILILKAPARKSTGTNPRTGEFDYLAYAKKTAGQRSQVVVRLIEQTEHSFANRYGRQAVLLQVESWLRTHFLIPDTQSAGARRQPPAIDLDEVSATSTGTR
jgi:pimeloyl-ACP methyl ester carboxylesterase